MTLTTASILMLAVWQRPCLEALDLNGAGGGPPETFEDGETLLEATSRHGLEGIVAKRRRDPNRPGGAVFD